MGVISDPGQFCGPGAAGLQGLNAAGECSDLDLSDQERSILAVEQEFSRMVAGARRAMRSRASAMDASLLPYDFKVIGALWHHGTHNDDRPGMTASELTVSLDTDKSMVSRSIKRLHDIGFVRREADPSDARSQRIHLTEEAARRFRASGREQRLVVQERLRSWDQEQVEQLAQLLHKLNGPSTEEPAMVFPVQHTEG